MPTPARGSAKCQLHGARLAAAPAAHPVRVHRQKDRINSYTIFYVFAATAAYSVRHRTVPPGPHAYTDPAWLMNGAAVNKQYAQRRFRPAGLPAASRTGTNSTQRAGKAQGAGQPGSTKNGGYHGTDQPSIEVCRTRVPGASFARSQTAAHAGRNPPPARMGLDDVRSKNEWWPFLNASPATFHPTPPPKARAAPARAFAVFTA